MTKEVLERYISNRLSSGDIFSDIKNDLLARGYSAEDIDEASPEIKISREERIPIKSKIEKPANAAAAEKNTRPKQNFIKTERILSSPQERTVSFQKLRELLVKLRDSGNKLKDNAKKIAEHKKIPAIGAIGIIILLLIIYFYSMKLDSIPKTIIVGSVYFLLFFAVILAKAGIMKVVYSSSRELPGIFKEILGIVICADIVMLFILPFTIGLTVFLPVIIGTIFFTIFILIFLKLGSDEAIVSIITYALFNFLILFLMRNIITYSVILRLFTGS